MMNVNDINSKGLVRKILSDPALEKNIGKHYFYLRGKELVSGALRSLFCTEVEIKSELVKKYFGEDAKLIFERSDYIDITTDGTKLIGGLDEEQYGEEDQLSPFAFKIISNENALSTHAENIFDDEEDVFDLLESILTIKQQAELVEKVDLYNSHNKRDKAVITSIFPNLVTA